MQKTGIANWRLNAQARRKRILASGKTPVSTIIRKNRLLLLMLLPAVVYVLLFSYWPMTGIVLAFKNYRYKTGIYLSPWVGLENFKFLLLAGKLGSITRNTVLYNFAFLFVNTTVEVFFAVMLSEVIGRHFKKVTQTLMFLPHFISWVVVKAVMYNLFNYEKGVVNNILLALGQTPFNLYNQPGAWPPFLIFLSLWKRVGYGSVVYLASVTSLDREMFEAADIDGANIWQKMFKITIPTLVPTIIIMLLLGIGNIFRGDFGMFYQTTGGSAALADTTEIIDTYVFRALMSSGDIGMAAASSFYQSVLCFLTIIFFNWVVKRYEKDYSLF